MTPQELRLLAAARSAEAAALRCQAATIEATAAVRQLSDALRANARRSWDLHHYAPLADRLCEGIERKV